MAAAAVYTPSGSDSSQRRACISPCTKAPAHGHSSGSTMPAKVNGTTTSVTSGIATRLAAKPTKDTCWKNSRLSGARPTLATTWVRSPARSRSRQPLRRRAPTPGSTTISSATATNDSQKPGCSSAHGSASVTTTAAANSTSTAGQRRAPLRSSATVTSIHTVRCAGTPQPAISA